jgi:hypothetical protein
MLGDLPVELAGNWVQVVNAEQVDQRQLKSPSDDN